MIKTRGGNYSESFFKSQETFGVNVLKKADFFKWINYAQKKLL